MAKAWPASEVEAFISLIDDPGHKVIDGHYHLSETQARAILELRLQRLTGMERDKLADETRELADQIEDYLEILSSSARLTDVVLEELKATHERLDNPRRTEISDALADQDDEDLIQQEDMVVTVSHRGYIKRVALSDYRAQRRGGKGRTGMKTREEDFVTRLFVANTHTPILFFTSKGMVYQLKCYKLPVASPQAIGKAMVNMLPIAPEETIQTVMPMPQDEASWEKLNILFATAKGNIRRNLLSDFTNIMRNGKIAMKLDEDDSLIGVLPCQDADNVLLASRNGKAIRFAVDEVRVFKGRGSVGVRGMRLLNKDYLVSMCVIRDPNREFVLSITENGYGKRTSVGDYRRTGRGGQGVANIETSDRNGLVVASFTVFAEDQLMLVTDAGKVIRIRVDGGEGDTIRVAGRKTQGVRLFEVDGTEKVVSVGVIRDADTDDEEEELGSELGSDLDAELDAELGAGDAVADTNAMQASAEGAETTDSIDTDGADADDADTNGADATSPNTDEAP
jgi:DNA gyrase subunit A